MEGEKNQNGKLKMFVLKPQSSGSLYPLTEKKLSGDLESQREKGSKLFCFE